jgi:hypothetical protein
MHTAETQQKFIQQRARGLSLVHIASELGVARSTLIEWSRKFRFEIQNQRAIELDDLRNRLLGSRESRASQYAARLATVEDELRKRDLSQLSTPRLFALADSLRRNIERETAATRFASPVKDIPNGEYVEEIQEWTV